MLQDKFWIWGHPTNSLKNTFGLTLDSNVSPVMGMKQLNAKNIFFVPFKHECDKEKEAKEMNENCLSFGMSIECLSDVDTVIELKKKYQNLNIAIFDDFLCPENITNYSIYSLDKLLEIKEKLNKNGIEMWMVYYEKQMDIDISQYLDVFDGFTFWFWKQPNEKQFLEISQEFFRKTPNKPRMLGLYLYDFGNRQQTTSDIVLYQLEKDKEYLEEGLIKGVILHTNAVGNMGFKAYDTASKWLENK